MNVDYLQLKITGESYAKLEPSDKGFAINRLVFSNDTLTLKQPFQSILTLLSHTIC